MKIKLILLSLVLPVAAQTVVYVDPRATTGNNDGSSWENAYLDLNFAIESAAATAPAEVWVVEGTYRPTAGSDRALSFTMAEGVDLYGGFAGTETDRAESDPVACPTILSGDLRRDDDTVGIAENSFHVLRGTGVTFKMDGFTISGGNASGASGGGFNGSGSATFSRCIFRNNVAATGGGAIFWSGPSIVLEDCQFISNEAVGGIGGAIRLDANSALSARRTVFVDNKANANGGEGGAIGSANPNNISINLLDCALRENQSTSGGAVSMQSSGSLTLIATNCEFTGNYANGWGGAVHTAFSTTLSIQFINCVFVGNRAERDGFTVTGGAVWAANPRFSNCIIWNNSANGSTATPESSLFTNVISISHSLIENWNPPGTGNIDGTNPANAPLFVTTIDPAASPTADPGDLRLQLGSPALDSGDNAANSEPLDLAGEPRIQNTTIDLGPREAIPIPEIRVFDGSGNALANHGAPIDLGPLRLEDGSATVEFLIVNPSVQVLSDLLATPTGLNADDVTLTAPPPASLAAYLETPIEITLALTSAGNFAAVLEIASNDADENPFEIPLIATIASSLVDSDGDALDDYAELLAGTDPTLPDSDGDGVPDGTEVALAAFGFVNGQDDSALLAALQASAPGLGLYTESNLQSLALDRPVLNRDPGTGNFTLKTGVLVSPDLTQPFAPLTGFAPSYDHGTGEILIEFPPPEPDSAFFQIFGTAP